MDTMEIVAFKKKKYLILLFVMLALSAVTAVIYLFANPRIDGSTSYTVDKYSDITNWCDANQEGEKLTFDCKALLVDIDLQGCFQVQVITKERELEELKVCEDNDTLSYTNDVLGYKTLMPVDMVFTYSKEARVREYSFNNVSFTKIDNTYLQSIVNEDIADLVTIDPSTTTIQNSVDFCPKPNVLPEYITDENTRNYSSYTNINSSGTKATEVEIYDTSNEVINSFLPCYNSNSCKYSNLLSTALLESSEVFSPKWGKDLSNYDYDTLAQLSYFYIGQNKILPTYAPYIAEGKEPYITTPKEGFAKIVKILSSTPDISEEIFCTVYKAVDYFSMENKDLVPLRNSMQGHINSNIFRSTFPLCYESMVEDIYDKNGIYIMYIMSIKDDSLKILNRCLNLNKYL